MSALYKYFTFASCSALPGDVLVAPITYNLNESQVSPGVDHYEQPVVFTTSESLAKRIKECASALQNAVHDLR